MKMEKESLGIHSEYACHDVYGALNMPVYHTLAYEFKDAKSMSDAFCGCTDVPDYSRITNPTVINFERIVRSLTGSRDVIAFNSGMAAISNAVMALAQSGKKIVTSRHLFGNTFLLFTDVLRRFGVGTEFCDLTDITDLKESIDADTCCIFLEIMTNPQMEVADIRAIADVAHAANIPVIADTTMIPFTHFNAASLGIDVEVVSSTKYFAGGGTSLGGLVIDYGTIEGFDNRMRREMLMNLGAYMNPHAAYMQTLGIETIHARYGTQQRNATAVAEALSSIPSITVNYPGLATNRYHDICVRQFNGNFGAMITFELPSEESCFKFIDSLKMIHRATNLFDNRSLAIHPASTIFGTLSQKQRDEMDISPTLIRLSIGLEHTSDIINDLYQAIKAAI